MPQQKDIEYFTLLFNKEFSVWYDNKNLIRIIMYVISLLFIILITVTEFGEGYTCFRGRKCIRD